MTNEQDTGLDTTGTVHIAGGCVGAPMIAHGGERECPVGLDVVVTITRRDGTQQTAPAGHFWSVQDYQNSWKHNGGNCDIVAYVGNEESAA